jgi:hypothetical protein
MGCACLRRGWGLIGVSRVGRDSLFQPDSVQIIVSMPEPLPARNWCRQPGSRQPQAASCPSHRSRYGGIAIDHHGRIAQAGCAGFDIAYSCGSPSFLIVDCLVSPRESGVEIFSRRLFQSKDRTVRSVYGENSTRRPEDIVERTAVVGQLQKSYRRIRLNAGAGKTAHIPRFAE